VSAAAVARLNNLPELCGPEYSHKSQGKEDGRRFKIVYDLNHPLTKKMKKVPM
jgi:hypothetical protein